MIKNEFNFIFTKRKILLYVLVVLSFSGLFFFKYDREYKNYSDTQIEYYSNMIDVENQRIKMASDEDLLKFFNEDMTYCQKLLSDFRQEEEIETIAQDLYERDCMILSYINQGTKLSSFPSILQNTKKDLKIRIKQEKRYLENEYYDFVLKNKPTGFYMLAQLFEKGNFFFYLMIILILIINVDIWSKDLENKTIRYVLISGKSRNSIYTSRMFMNMGISLFLSLICVLLLFGLGCICYGTGQGLYIGLIPISTYVLNRLIEFIVIEIFAISMIQFVSFFTQNTGISMMLGGLALLFMYVYLDLSNIWGYTPFILNISILIQCVLFISFMKMDLG